MSIRALASHSRMRLSSWRRVTRFPSTAPCLALRSRKKALSSCRQVSQQFASMHLYLILLGLSGKREPPAQNQPTDTALSSCWQAALNSGGHGS